MTKWMVILTICILGAVIYASGEAYSKESSSAVSNASFKKGHLYSIKINDLDGKPFNLDQYRGKSILFVNVASFCGFTRQYKGLQSVYESYKDKNFVIIGVPSNDFGEQEPGSSEEIKEFCMTRFAISFPLTEKVNVVGVNQHPLYHFLTTSGSKKLKGDVKWNFSKILVNPDGIVQDRFSSMVTPESKKIKRAIESL